MSDAVRGSPASPDPFSPGAATLDEARAGLGAAPARLPWRVVLGYAAGQLGTSLLPLLVITWMMPFYSTAAVGGVVLLAPEVLGTLRMVERVFGSGFEPIVGYLSDRFSTPWGRRLPWIALGLPFLVGSFVMLWFPPAATTTNDPRVVAHCALALIVFYASYTCVVAPFVSMLPEITPHDRERVRLSVWMSLQDVVANIGGALGAGSIVALGAVVVAGVAMKNGYEVLGVGAGVIALLSFLPVLFFVREPPGAAERQVTYSVWRAVVESLKNRAFLPYALCIFGFRFATNAAIVGLYYIATVLMGTDEEGVGIMQATIIGVAVLSFPIIQRLVNRYGAARVFTWAGVAYVLVLPLMGAIGLVPGLSPMTFGRILFVLAGFSTGCVFVIPRTLLADVIDLDFERTGFRREAMYNGMSGVAEKFGEAFGMGSVGWLVGGLGGDAEHTLGIRLVGVCAAVAVAIGLVGFRWYPARGQAGR